MDLLLILIVLTAGVVPPAGIAAIGYLMSRRLSGRVLERAEAIRDEARLGITETKTEMKDFTKKEILQNYEAVGGDLVDTRQEIFKAIDDSTVGLNQRLERILQSTTDFQKGITKELKTLKRTPEEEAAFFKRMRKTMIHAINGKVGSVTKEITQDLKESPDLQAAHELVNEFQQQQEGALGGGFGNRIAAAVEKNITEFLTK